MTQKFLLEDVDADTATPNADGVYTLGSTVNIDVQAINFGGGTVNIFGSLDNGVTRTLLEFEDGTPVQILSDSIIQISRLAHAYRLYASLTGSTSPNNVTVQVVY